MMKNILQFVLAVVVILSPSMLRADEDHPDIEIEVEGGNVLEIHGPTILNHYEFYAFIDIVPPNNVWRTFHASTNWPGIGAESGTFSSSTAINLVITTPLYYWDGVSIGGFSVVSDSTTLRIYNPSFTNSLDVTGSSGEQVWAGLVSSNPQGGIHAHPAWQLIGVGGGEPLNGAYLTGIQVAASGYETSDEKGLLLHKGLSSGQHVQAITHALAIVPEPASATLLLLGGAFALMRKRKITR